MLDTDKRTLRGRLNESRLLYGSLMFAAAAGMGYPLLNADAAFAAKAIAAGSGIALSAASLTQIEEMQRLNKLVRGVDKTQVEQAEFHYATQAQLDSLESAIERYATVLERIERLPPQFQPLFAEFAGISIPTPPPPPRAEPEAIAASPTILEAREDALVDTSWLTEDLIRESNIVVGPKGQGKSTWIECEATNYLALHPEGTLIIIDLHFDPDDPEADQIQWFPGNSPERYMNRIIFNNIDSAWNAFCTFMSECRDRVDSKDTKRPWAKIIIDECNGFFDRLNKGQKEYFLNETKFVEYEARKYKVRQTFSFKTVKKEVSMVDLSVFGSMNWLLLGNAITLEKQQSLPTDFNQAALSVEWQEATYKLAPIKSQAKAGVLRVYGDSAPTIITVPRELPVPKLNLGGAAPTSEEGGGLQQLLSDLQQWIQELGRTPSDEELAGVLAQMTGQEFEPNAIAYIKGELGL